jgi:hypothetical protein
MFARKPSDGVKNCETYFPGFIVSYYKDETTKDPTKINNYVIQHSSKEIAIALSKKLGDDVKIKGSAVDEKGLPKNKYVADHRGNSLFGIVLTDKDLNAIIGHEGFGRRMSMDGKYDFRVSADSLRALVSAPVYQ